MSRRARLAALLTPLVLALAGGGALLALDRGDEAPPAAGALNAHPVAGNFKPDDTRLAACRDQACWEQGFGNLAYSEGPKAALAEFDRRLATDTRFEAACHRVVHTIGSAALARYDGNVARAFAEGSSSCWSGYYHGILERALVDAGTKPELVTVARRLCADEGVRATTFIAYQCVHGIGHGLMIQTGLNMPLSLSVCEQLATAWDQTSCDGGVFMENFNSSYGVKSKWLRDDDPVYPCRDVQDKHKLYCYLMVTSRTLQLNGYDFDQTAATCKTVETDWVETCFNSMGRDASGQSTQDPQRVVELCSKAGRDFWDDCIWGAARDMAATFSNGERASKLCLRLPETMRATCFWQVGTILGTMSPTAEGRRKLCAAATRRYLDDCLRGAAA